MDNFTLDSFRTGVILLPAATTLLGGGDKLTLMKKNFVSETLSVDHPDFPGDDYIFPEFIGSTEQVMNPITPNKDLVWQTQMAVSTGTFNFAYDKIEDADTTLPSYSLLGNQYLVEIRGSGITKVFLPDADGIAGRQYIVSKGYSGGTLSVNVSPTSGDTFEGIGGLTSINLVVENQRLKVTSSGEDRWIII